MRSRTGPAMVGQHAEKEPPSLQAVTLSLKVPSSEDITPPLPMVGWLRGLSLPNSGMGEFTFLKYIFVLGFFYRRVALAGCGHQ